MIKSILLSILVMFSSMHAFSQCDYYSQNSDGVWAGETNSTIDFETTGNYQLTTLSGTIPDTDGNSYHRYINGGEQAFKIIDEGSLSLTFSPAVPANEIAFSINDIDAGSFSNTQSYTLQINGGAPNGAFEQETITWLPPMVSYDATTGIAVNDGNIDNQVNLVRGVDNTLVTSIEIVASNLGGDHVSYSFYARPYCDLTGIENNLQFNPTITTLGNSIHITGKGEVSVFNLTGQRVSQQKLMGNNSISLRKGIYLVRVTSKGHTTTKKVYLN
ncbi:MAG: T9SS type A sorting domain-containing protein [Flavobacteriales bacterium]|nr:T9SS type A sorting domain-containing protein [Flavobacteriales bacterium]